MRTWFLTLSLSECIPLMMDNRRSIRLAILSGLLLGEPTKKHNHLKINKKKKRKEKKS
jgi:hypothetical protein